MPPYRISEFIIEKRYNCDIEYIDKPVKAI